MRAADTATGRTGRILWPFDDSGIPGAGGANGAPFVYMVAGHEYVADVFGGNHVDRARYASPSRVGDAVIAFELPTASMQTAENYFPASHVEVVTIVASGWASAASVPYAISDRPTGMVVRTGSIPLTNGTGAGTVVGLGCGRYVLRFHQPDGRVSRVRFPVTDGGTCKT